MEFEEVRYGMLMMVVCEALGGDTERAIPLAVGIEYVHIISRKDAGLISKNKVGTSFTPPCLCYVPT